MTITHLYNTSHIRQERSFQNESKQWRKTVIQRTVIQRKEILCVWTRKQIYHAINKFTLLGSSWGLQNVGMLGWWVQYQVGETRWCNSGHLPRPKAFSVVAKCSDDTNPDIVNPSLVYHGMPLLSYNNGVSQTSWADVMKTELSPLKTVLAK